MLMRGKNSITLSSCFFCQMFFPCSDLIFWGVIREVKDSLGKSKKISGTEYYRYIIRSLVHVFCLNYEGRMKGNFISLESLFSTAEGGCPWGNVRYSIDLDK